MGVRRRIDRLIQLLRALDTVPARLDAVDTQLEALRDPARLDAIDGRLGELRAAVRDPARLDAIEAQLAELRDSVHLTARRTALRRRPTRVLFLVHVLGAWDSYHALAAAMAASDDFEPVVATIPRRFRGSDGLYGEDAVHRGLAARGVPHLRFAGDALPLLKAIEPDLVLRQSQWDADVPDDLTTEHLGFARTCLVPYETMNIVRNVADGDTPNTAVDSAYHRHAWLVFCTNEEVRATAVRDGVRDGAQFRVVGHPKADHLRTVAPHWPLPDGAAGGRPGRVVWSAHHTIAEGWTDFGAFHLMADAMLAWARCRDDVQFVFMPHPALLPFPDAPESPIDRAEFDGWMREWAVLPNTAVLSESEYGPTLAASDVMVTDGLSMLVEYQLLTKPLVFFERSGHRPFNEIGERVVRGVHTVHAVDEVRGVVEKFLDGEPDPLVARQRENVAELFGDGDSVARILAVLRAEIAAERGGA